MEFDSPAQLEGIGEDGIIIGTDVSQQAELQLTAAGDFEVSTAGGVTQFTLDDPTQSVVTTQDGVMSYLIQGTEASSSDIQHADCTVEPDNIAISEENLSIQVPSLVKVNVPTIDGNSGLTTTQSVYITLSQDGQVTVKKEQDEEVKSDITEPQVVAQDGNVTLVNVAGNNEINASSKTQSSSLVQLTQDGKVNIVSRAPAIQPQIQLQQVMLPNGAVAYLNAMASNSTDNVQLTVGNNSATIVPNTSKENSSLEGVTLDEGSITYITANMVPEAGDLGDTTLSLGEATNLQKVTDGDECSNGSEDKTVDLGDAELPNLLGDQGSSLIEAKVTDGSLPLVEKAFKCPFNGCDRFYTTLHHLRVHERSHTGDKPYNCSQEGCGKSFATAYGLKSHTRIHTGEKPYKCPMDQCTKAFKTSGDLQKHVRTHTGEKPFKCPFEGCDKAFTTSNIRKVHIRVHTGERPYVCPIDGCGKSFSSATNYKNHIRIHTGERPYVCSVQGCGKKFTEYSSLYKHHVVHTHAKPYVCQFCGKTYRQTSTLAMHIRAAHGEEAHLPDTEYVLARDRIFTVGVEDNEGALVINTAEPNQGSVSTSSASEKVQSNPTSKSPNDTMSTFSSNINVIQAPPGGSVVSLPSELQGQRVFVITEPAQLQLLQQLSQSSQFPAGKSDGVEETSLRTEQMDSTSPTSPGLIIGQVNESEII